MIFCFLSYQGILINGQFPGPTVEAHTTSIQAAYQAKLALLPLILIKYLFAHPLVIHAYLFTINSNDSTLHVQSSK